MSDNIKTLGGMPVGGTFLMEVGSKTVRATPFGAKETISEPVVVMDLETVEFEKSGGNAMATLPRVVDGLEAGDIVKLTIDNQVLEGRLEETTVEGFDILFIGNLHLNGAELPDSGEEYLLYVVNVGAPSEVSVILDAAAAGVKAVSLEYRKVGTEVAPMPKELLPEALQFGEEVTDRTFCDSTVMLMEDGVGGVAGVLAGTGDRVQFEEGMAISVYGQIGNSEDGNDDITSASNVETIDCDVAVNGSGEVVITTANHGTIIIKSAESSYRQYYRATIGNTWSVKILLLKLTTETATVTPLDAKCLPEIPIEKLPESHRFGESVETVFSNDLTSYEDRTVLNGFRDEDGKLHIVFDGAEYVLTPKNINDEGGWDPISDGFVTYIGNTALYAPLAGFEADDVPFFFAWFQDYQQYDSTWTEYRYSDTSTTHSLVAKKETTTITPIDPKFIPKAAAVADITAAPTAEEYNALLASLRAAGYLAE